MVPRPPPSFGPEGDKITAEEKERKSNDSSRNHYEEERRLSYVAANGSQTGPVY